MPTPSGYHGRSLEKDLEKIKKLYLSGDSAPTIATKLYKDINKKNTVDAAIKSMISGEAPVKIDKPREATSGRNQFEAVRKDPERLNKILKDIPKMSRRQVLEKHGISSDALGKIVKDNEVEFGIVEKGKPQFREYVTENIKTLHDAILKNPDATASQLMEATGLSTRQYNSTVDGLQKTYLRDRPGFKPNKKIENNVFNLKSNIPTTFESTLDNPEAVKSLNKVRKSLTEFFPKKGTNFEHNLPQTLLSYIDDAELKDELLLTGSRTSPELNQFKRIYDIKSKKAVDAFLEDEISLNEYNKRINQIRNDVRKATGGYEIGYLKFDKNKNPTPVVDVEPLTQGYKDIGPESYQKIKAFENVKYHENLRRNYFKDPENPIFTSLKKYEPNPEAIADYSDYLKDYKKIEPNLKNQKSILNFAEKNINNKVVRALFKSPYGAAAAVTVGALTPTALMAKTPTGEMQTAIQDQAVETQPEQSIEQQIVEATTPKLYFDKDLMTFMKDPETVADQSDKLYWLADNPIAEHPLAITAGLTAALAIPGAKETYEVARSAGRGPTRSAAGVALKGLGRAFTPLPVAIMDAAEVGSELAKGTSASDILTSPTTYMNLAFLEGLPKTPGQYPSAGALGKVKDFFNLKNVSATAEPGIMSAALRMGLSPRVIAGAGRFLGIPGLIASSAYTAYDMYDQYKQNKKREELGLPND